jgi:hypothetical protein
VGLKSILLLHRQPVNELEHTINDIWEEVIEKTDFCSKINDYQNYEKIISIYENATHSRYLSATTKIPDNFLILTDRLINCLKEDYLKQSFPEIYKNLYNNLFDPLKKLPNLGKAITTPVLFPHSAVANTTFNYPIRKYCVYCPGLDSSKSYNEKRKKMGIKLSKEELENIEFIDKETFISEFEKKLER